MTKIEQTLAEISLRKRILEIKRQVQTAENDKELSILTLWENSIERLKEAPVKTS